jgi:hypothetical protein
MNLYLISRKEDWDYNNYDSAVVAAATEEDARKIHPSGGSWDAGNWASKPELVDVEFIGTAHDEVEGVILSSFNAG